MEQLTVCYPEPESCDNTRSYTFAKYISHVKFSILTDSLVSSMPTGMSDCLSWWATFILVQDEPSIPCSHKPFNGYLSCFRQ